MGKQLNEKKIVVVGGTTGIGLSAAKAFIGEGAKVVATGRNQESALLAREIFGNDGEVLTGDAREPGSAQKAIDLCLKTFGGFDGLYHVAGGSGRRMGDGPLHELTLDGWNKTLELNLTSIMLSNQAAVRTFLERKTAGSILNMSSVLGFSPSPIHFATHAYAAAKAAINGFTKSTASFYARNNIRLNVIAPSLVETPMAKRASEDDRIQAFIKTKQPLDQGRIGQPGDLDGLAIYFMSEQSRFTTGQVIAVDGGWCLSEGQY